MHLSAGNEYRAVALWAPSAADGAERMRSFVGGEQAWLKMRKQAEQEGFVPFTTAWGQYQELGPQWFADLQASKPSQFIQEYTGHLMVLYGDQDTVVPPEVAELALSAATSARSKTRVVVPGADHGLGLFNGDDASVQKTVDSTVAFLSTHLE